MIENKKSFKKLNKSIFVKKFKSRSTFLWVCDDWQNEQKTKIICLEKFSKCLFSSSMIVWSTHSKKKLTYSKTYFFKISSLIDLIDISRYFYFKSIEYSSSITKTKVFTIIKRFVFNKTSNFDDFIDKLFKSCAFIMIKLFIILFKICIQLFYHSKTFKKVNTIISKKTKKDDYIISKMYQLIIFLNIKNKIMKSIMNKQIAWLTKTHQLFLDFHIKCRKNKSIESTLKLFTKQMHIIWNKNTNQIVILLSLDVIEAFDTISHERLIHNLRKRRISKWEIDWIINFLQNRTTILTMNRRMIVSFEINTKFLKYVNNVNILIYNKSTNKNCKNLKQVHKFYEKWVTRHEFLFVSIKYELIHFIINSKKFDIIITIKIESNIIQSKIDIQILKIQIDIYLK
jgi:hypothetical protein